MSKAPFHLQCVFHVKHIHLVSCATPCILDVFSGLWKNTGMKFLMKRSSSLKGSNERLTTKKVGELGECVASEYLRSKGFEMVTRNYTRKWGEIDIIGIRNAIVHFVEVKTVSHETKEQLEWTVTHETWKPEELVHRFKLNQIKKTAETWIMEHNWTEKVQIDVVAVRMVPREKFAVVNFIENIVTE